MARIPLALILGSAIAFAAQTAKISVPADWTAMPVDDAELKPLMRPGTLRSDARRWVSPESESTSTSTSTSEVLTVLELEIRNGPTGNVVDAFEDAVPKQFPKAQQLSKVRRQDGERVVVDHVLRVDDAVVQMRRTYAADASDVVHVALGLCISEQPSPACAAALDTLALPVDAVPLRYGARSSSAYETGRWMGQITLAVLFAAFLWSNRKKLARRRKD